VSKKERPALEPVDLTPTNNSVTHLRRTASDDPRFAAASELESHAGLAKRIEAGHVKVLNRDTMPTPKARWKEEHTVSAKVPSYVIRQLRQRYADTGITIRNQLLTALKKDGIEVNPDDITDDRKRANRDT
jgi:hypothetical protein